jgi:SAM-dependent methyltransferase
VDAEQILGEISAYCRETGLAESTFGRLAVNDGKLIARLRYGGRITTATLGRIRGFIAQPRPAGRRPDALIPAAAAPVPAIFRAAGEGPRNFRFFDNRQKYLLFVNTCSEKWAIAHRVSLELANIHPRPPALRLFDAGMGDGTVLTRVMRATHERFPTMPFYIVGKEISLEDVRLTLEKLADRFFEHPATVVVLTNLYYAEAPWLTVRSLAAANSLVWHELPLAQNSSHAFEQQIVGLHGFLADNWKAGMSGKTGNPVYERPVVLVIYREDHRFLLDAIIPRRGKVEADYDLVIASQPYRARAPLDFKANRVVAPLARALGPGGRLVGIHSRGDDPGMEIVHALWPDDHPFGDGRHEILRAVKQELGAAGLRHAYPAERTQRLDRHLDPLRRLERRHLCGADRG